MTTTSPGRNEEGEGAFLPPGDGAVNASPKSRKSRVWIIWVVLSVVLVSAVAALTVLTPSLIAAMTTGSSASGAPPIEHAVAPSTEDSNGEVDSFLSPADEQAAIETVEQHDWAWLIGDCDGYFETTTERFRRDVMETTDCDAFAAEVRLRADAEPFTATVTKVEAIGSAIGVLRSSRT